MLIDARGLLTTFTTRSSTTHVDRLNKIVTQILFIDQAWFPSSFCRTQRLTGWSKSKTPREPKWLPAYPRMQITRLRQSRQFRRFNLGWSIGFIDHIKPEFHHYCRVRIPLNLFLFALKTSCQCSSITGTHETGTRLQTNPCQRTTSSSPLNWPFESIRRFSINSVHQTGFS